MKEHENTRTGLQRAVDLAYAARAARRILQAAAAGGLHGAAAVAVKETAPFLVKRLLAVLVALIVLPMVIFTALPNIFFGYRSSDTDAIAQMTGQAMTIGGVYMSLDDFEAAQIDSVVTGIVAEYEESGTNIDRIEVSGSVTEKDLLWIIAINSAAYQQDLNAMSADLVRNFCKSSLSYFPSLGLAEDGGDGVVTTLTVKVKHLDPDELMDELGFDKDAKQWAGALYETLEQSDAINKYRTYFETHRPDYSGDGSYSGDVQYGTDYDNMIDISGFIDPSTKNNLDLAAYAIQAWENNWGYVWGTYGNILTRIKSSNTRMVWAITLILSKATGSAAALPTVSDSSRATVGWTPKAWPSAMRRMECRIMAQIRCIGRARMPACRMRTTGRYPPCPSSPASCSGRADTRGSTLAEGTP